MAAPALPSPLLAFITLILCVVGTWGQWMQGLTDAMTQDAEAVTVSQLVAEGGGIPTEMCGGPSDALRVEGLEVQADALALIVRGNLTRRVHGGTVHMRMNLVRPKGLTMAKHFKYVAAQAFTRARRISRPLCGHVHGALDSGDASGSNCVLEPGHREWRFRFNEIPKFVFVGHYVLDVSVADEEGLPVTCVRGRFTISEGQSDSILRKLEENIDCPPLVAENWDSIAKAYVRDECQEYDGVRYLSFVIEMKEGVDFRMPATWWGTWCDDPTNYDIGIHRKFDATPELNEYVVYTDYSPERIRTGCFKDTSVVATTPAPTPDPVVGNSTTREPVDVVISGAASYKSPEQISLLLLLSIANLVVLK